MVKYTYKAINTEGKKVSGNIVVQDTKAFFDYIRAQELSCYEYRSGNSIDPKTRLKKLKTNTLVNFSRQLSSMLVAGLDLGLSLKLLYDRMPSSEGQLKKILAVIYENVQQGQSFADSLVQMKDVFPPLYVAMIKSGEMNGKIDQTLVDLGDHYERQMKQDKQIKSAMMYPVILGIIAVLVVSLLLFFVMPKMVAMIPPGQELPGPTKILFNLKNFVQKNFFLVIAIIAILKVFFRIMNTNDLYREFKGKLMIRLPKFGPLLKMRYTSQFASTIASLYSTGVSILDSIQMSIEIINNYHLKKTIKKASVDIRRGSTIADAIGKVDGFDKLLVTMIFVGEQSGSLEEILGQTADYFDEEANQAIKGMVSMISPIMLLVMAFVIGFIIIATLMPMFSVYKNIENQAGA